MNKDSTDPKFVKTEKGITAILSSPNRLRINEMFAFVSVDDEGNKGICAVTMGDVWMPLIGADMARVNSFKEKAQWLADHNPGTEIKLLKFSTREEIEIIKARDIKCKKCGEGPWHECHRAYFVADAHPFEE